MLAITEEELGFLQKGWGLERKELLCMRLCHNTILILCSDHCCQLYQESYFSSLAEPLLGLTTLSPMSGGHPPPDSPWVSLGYHHLMKGPWPYYFQVQWTFLSSQLLGNQRVFHTCCGRLPAPNPLDEVEGTLRGAEYSVLSQRMRWPPCWSSELSGEGGEIVQNSRANRNI